MPKIYSDKDAPERKKDDVEPVKKTVGVYDKPGRKGPSKGAIVAVVIALLVLLVILFLAGFTYADTTLPLLPGLVEFIAGSARFG